MLTSLRASGLVCLLLMVGCVSENSSNFDRELQAGIAASGAQPEKAIEHLERAVKLNPGSVKGHLALANAYRAAFNEGDFDDGEVARANKRLFDRALEEYKTVVTLDPSSAEALNRLGSNYFFRAEFEQAEFYLRESLKVNPSEKEALYSLAALDWLRSSRLRLGRRDELHLRSGAPLIDNRSCVEIRLKNLEQVEEAITMLKKLSQMGDFRDVPYFLAFLYRERADIQCGDRAAYDMDLRSAKELELVACAARKRGAEVLTYWPPVPPPPPYLKCW